METAFITLIPLILMILIPYLFIKGIISHYFNKKKELLELQKKTSPPPHDL